MNVHMPDERLIKSYVWHEGKCYFVSTINRDSSSEMGGRLSETMVWNFDWDKNERGKHILFSDGGGQGYIGKHLQLCQRIFETGTFEDKDE